MLGDKAEQRRADQAADLADQAPETEEPPARVGRRHVRAEHLHAPGRNRMAGMHPEKSADKNRQPPLPVSVTVSVARSMATKQRNSAENDVERGRERYARRAWADAHEALSRASAAAPLEADDFERLVLSAGLSGRDDEQFKLFEQLYQLYLDGGDELGAARAAFWLGFRLVNTIRVCPLSSSRSSGSTASRSTCPES